MDVELLPRGYDYNYMIDVYNVAQKLGSKAIFAFTKDRRPYVYIEGVVLTCKRTFLFGQGTTMDDACNDYMRKIRGLTVKNDINNKEGSFV